MENLKSKSFWESTLARSIRTFCQTLLSLITVGSLIQELDWITILSVSATATLCSVLTSIVLGIPEADSGVE